MKASILLEEGIGFAGVAKVCSMAFRRLEVVDVLAKSIVVVLQHCVLSFRQSLGLFRCAALLCQVMCSFELPFWCQGANLQSGISCCLSSKCSRIDRDLVITCAVGHGCVSTDGRSLQPPHVLKSASTTPFCGMWMAWLLVTPVVG